MDLPRGRPQIAGAHPPRCSTTSDGRDAPAAIGNVFEMFLADDGVGGRKETTSFLRVWAMGSRVTRWIG